MKSFKYTIALLAIAAMFTACDGNRKNATLGNTSDTSTVVGVKDTSANGDTTKTDSASDGNVNPTAHQKQ